MLDFSRPSGVGIAASAVLLSMEQRPSPDDANLLRRIASGDGDALTRLFDMHSPVVLGLLIRMLGGRAEAEEVLQEVFLQVWMQADRYEESRSSPRGWILMLARSRALDRLRRRSSQQRREEEVASEEGVAVRPVGTARLEAAERRSRIGEALGLLSPEQRHCIELAFFEGLTHTQIAERLKAPLGTVKSRILLGMNKLRQALSTS
ncbi:MAG TPA: sigma-70 family RNA polymerase sigma factor [Thermoanaerobaculia bacterium]|nr:sigma-70 family RNA polymerase sigma factor [Thermoanaerobaculia bacterium]